MGGVTFRRIGGRVIPIRQGGSTDKSKSGKGGKEIAAGLAVGAAAGAASAELASRHAYAHNAARKSAKILKESKFKLKSGVAGENALKFMHAQAVKDRHLAMGFSRAADNVKNHGAKAGATLIGIGVHKALKNSDLNEGQKVGIATASGIGSHFALRSIYTHTIGKTGLRKAMKHAIERIAVKGFKI